MCRFGCLVRERYFSFFTTTAITMDKAEMDEKFCSGLVKVLNDFRNEGLFCDVTISVGGTLFSAHRNVLAANSPYFNALLSNEMKETLDNTIKLDELSAKVMRSILDYMYSGEIDINKENALDVTVAADYMLMPDLKNKGCNFLLRKMTASNCLTILKVAEKYNFAELYGKALKFAQENYHAICKKENFKSLSATQFEEIISGNDLVAKEEDVFESLVEWVNFDLDTRRRLFHELFSHVRLIYLPRNYLILVVEENEMIRRSEICLQQIATAKEYLSSPQKIKQTGRQVYQPRGCQHALFTTGGLQSDHGYKVAASTSLFIPAISKCFPVSPMLTPRKNHGIAMYEGMVYVVGGESDDEAALRSVELYDPKANSWSSVMCLRKEVSGVGVTVLGDYLYAVGGCDIEGSPLDVVQRYSPQLNRWQYVARMNSSRTRHSVVTANGFLYALGGYGADDYLPLKSVELYDPEADRWINISPMRRRRSDMCCVCVDQIIYVVGGEDILDNVMKLDCCEMYEPATDTWRVMTLLPSPLSHAGVAAVRNKIYLFGGLDVESKELDSIMCFDIETKKWRVVGFLPFAIEGGACCTITLPGELMSSIL